MSIATFSEPVLQQSDKTLEFIAKARAVHGDKYSYEGVDYKNNRKPVKILCLSCDKIFPQIPKNHLTKSGCPECAGNQVKTLEQFIAKARAVHGDKYSYGQVDYKNAKTEVNILCHKCNKIFPQRPKNHLNQKQGCPDCAGNQVKTTEQFIAKARAVHGDKYSYGQVDYKNTETEVNILCHKCNKIFPQTPHEHLKGHGCRDCARMEQTKTLEQFITEARAVHGDKYSYGQVNYKNTDTKVKILCHKCNKIFSQKPSSHLAENGCPRCCGGSISKPETRWLDRLGITERQVWLTLSTGRRVKVDGYDPATNTVYEHHGTFWHGDPNRYDDNEINPRNKKTYGELRAETLEREQAIRDSGYRLVVKWERELLEEERSLKKSGNPDSLFIFPEG
jgi:predicted  nucleic acid-binding Zn-ribbon protein